MQSTDNKQGRSNEALDPALAEKIRTSLADGQKAAYVSYNSLIEEGLARELARINLPLSLYTEWYWQIDLHNLFHFLDLRLDAHAQKEIRLYAKVLLDIAKKVAPRCCASFEKHVLGAVRFSADEFAELQKRLGVTPTDTPALSAGTNDPANQGDLAGKTLERFEEKLKSGRQL